MSSNIPLKIDHLSAAYDKHRIIHDVQLEVSKGQLVGIIGPNGAGKTTLVRAILGLIPIERGVVKIFGKPLKKVLKRVGYVPQKESVDWDFPVSVFDVVMMGCYNRIGLFKRPSKEDRDFVYHCLKKVEMDAFATRQISNLSGGQQQRIFLARALAQKSDLYFMDEPFASVDATTEKAIITVLEELRNEGKTLLVIHHDLGTAPDYFDHILLLNRQVIQFGPTKEVFTLDHLQKTYEGNLRIFHTPNSS